MSDRHEDILKMMKSVPTDRSKRSPMGSFMSGKLSVVIVQLDDRDAGRLTENIKRVWELSHRAKGFVICTMSNIIMLVFGEAEEKTNYNVLSDKNINLTSICQDIQIAVGDRDAKIAYGKFPARYGNMLVGTHFEFVVMINAFDHVLQQLLQIPFGGVISLGE